MSRSPTLLSTTSRKTQFRSELSRFTASLYDLGRPHSVTNKQTDKHHANLTDLLTPTRQAHAAPTGGGGGARLSEPLRSRSQGEPLHLTHQAVAMKPVQNLDSLNPRTGLPNIGGDGDVP